MSTNPTAGWARHYIARGWKLIPIHVLVNGACSCGKMPCGDTGDPGTPGYAPAGKNAGKHPVPRDWNNPLSAVQTELQVDRVWGNDTALQYSMGLLCGQPSRVWVLDVDPRNGGYESMETVEMDLDIPDTLKVRTGGGGLHYFFALPQGMILKKGPLHKDLPGIDVQAEGSQIVLPPSMHRSGQRYAWDVPLDTQVREAPEPLIQMIRGSRGSSGGGAGGAGVDLDKLMRDGIPDGERNNTLYKVACSFARKFGVDTDSQIQLVLSATKSFNQDFCKPPLDLDEIVTLLNSAVTFIRSSPAGSDISPEVQSWIEAQQARQSRTMPPAAPAKVAPTSVNNPASAKPAPEAPDLTGESLPESFTKPVSYDDSPEPDEAAPIVPDPMPPVPDVDVPSGDVGGSDDDPPALPPDADSLGDDGTPGMRTETDNGNARRIVDYFGHNLRYTTSAGWYYWDGLTWRPDDEGLYVTERARELPVQIVAEMVQLPMAMAQASTLVDWAHKSRDAGRIRKAVALANTDPRVAVRHSQWNADAGLLGVKNGVIDLRTGDLLAPHRSQYITKRTQIDYKPGKIDTRFKIFLEQVTGGDKELQEWLQRVVGYTLTGETNEQKFFLVYGPPGSGKSTILEIVRSLLGEYSLTLQAENIMQQKYGSSSSDQYYTAEIEGRRMIAVSELPEAELMKEDAVKRLTGGDTLMGRRIAQQPFSFTSQAKLWVATNHRPRVKDPGVWRRMKAIPFEHVPHVVDTGLKPYLQSPTGGLPGVMSWAVEGAVKWYASRDGIGKCSVVDEATEEYKKNEDEIGIFLSEECRKGEGLSISLYDVYVSYKTWLEDRGIMNPGPINKMQRSMSDRGMDIDGSGRRAVLRGWTLTPKVVAPAVQGQQDWTSMMR